MQQKKKVGAVLASLLLNVVVLGAPEVAAASVVAKAAAGNGSCAQAIDAAVWYFGYRRSTLSCNGAVRSNTWRVHHSNGCFTDVTFHNSGDISGGTMC